MDHSPLLFKVQSESENARFLFLGGLFGQNTLCLCGLHIRVESIRDCFVDAEPNHHLIFSTKNCFVLVHLEPGHVDLQLAPSVEAKGGEGDELTSVILNVQAVLSTQAPAKKAQKYWEVEEDHGQFLFWSRPLFGLIIELSARHHLKYSPMSSKEKKK